MRRHETETTPSEPCIRVAVSYPPTTCLPTYSATIKRLFPAKRVSLTHQAHTAGLKMMPSPCYLYAIPLSALSAVAKLNRLWIGRFLTSDGLTHWTCVCLSA